MLQFYILCDAPVSWQLSFQDAASPIMEGIVNLHNNIMMIITSIFLFVFFILVRSIQLFKFPSSYEISNITAEHQLETWWTVVPTIILCLIAGPSFAVLYGMDALILPQLTVKIIGRQWYWTYEDTCWSKAPLVFDSYMKSTDSVVEEGGFRLLSVDRSLVLPSRTAVRLLITSSDVLHSWAVPSLGVKMDACPGRLNQVTLFIKRPGFFYGQCSELCGINHAFMPVCIEALDINSPLDSDLGFRI